MLVPGLCSPLACTLLSEAPLPGVSNSCSDQPSPGFFLWSPKVTPTQVQVGLWWLVHCWGSPTQHTQGGCGLAIHFSHCQPDCVTLALVWGRHSVRRVARAEWGAPAAIRASALEDSQLLLLTPQHLTPSLEGLVAQMPPAT